MSARMISGAVALVIGVTSAAGAADFSDPTWPCIQRKVDRLSPGIMWPHPVEERDFDAATETAVRDLAARMALRRLSLEEIEPMLARFTADHGTGQALLGHLFMTAFGTMSRQRQEIMQGIAEYSLTQIALAGRIDATRGEMNRLMDAETPDYDRVDELEEQVAWDERIYTDRAQALIYVCETPVILEKRLYAIAQMLLRAAEG